MVHSVFPTPLNLTKLFWLKMRFLFMGSLDVDALFTSILLDETINIAVSELFINSSLINRLTKNDN